MARGDNPKIVERLRGMCLGLPGTTEKQAHGEPTWRVTDRMFATLADNHHDDRLAVWLNAPDGAQATLVEANPARFFRPPYMGPKGWVGVWLDEPPPDWDEVGMLVEQAVLVTIEQGEAVKARRRVRR